MGPITNTGFMAIMAVQISGNFLFIDTPILAQGKTFSEQEVKDLCPQK
ncbi:unnamed protein product, partial [Allacma fusca]